MPKTIELCFYEAGLRLGQFAILFATTTQRGGSNDLRFDQVSTSIDALRDAFERIEEAAPGLTRAVLRSQIRNCRELLERQRSRGSRHPRAVLLKSLNGRLLKIQQYVVESADQCGATDKAIQPRDWFWLGTTISAEGVPLPNGFRKQEMFRGSSADDQAELTDLLAKLRMTRDQLVLRKSTNSALFPYDVEPYADHWLELEGGLRQLQEEVPGGVEPVDGETGGKFLGLILDDGLRRVRREGMQVTIELGDSTIQWVVFAKLVHQRGTPIGPRRLSHLWSEHGREPDPDDGTITDTISKIRKRISRLDVSIKNTRGFGWWLQANQSATSGLS